MSIVRLRAETLRDAPGEVGIPGYDRGQLQVGIVHFGAGAFHRSHQAMYVDRLMRTGQARDWAICAVDVLEADRGKRAIFEAQDGLYTLVVKQPDGTIEPRVIGSIIEYLFAPDNPGRVLDRLTDPRTRIVSLTITEGGYNFHQATGEFDADNPAIRRDLAPGAVPGTVFGFITEALRRRRAAGVPPFTVMSCDNIEGNGNVARAMFGAFADLAEPGFGTWIREMVAFPNSMVDRITPVTTADDIEQLRSPLRYRRPLAGGIRAVHAVGSRRRIPARRASLGRLRRTAGGRRDAVRADEAPAAQRQPPGAGVPGLPRRVQVRARGRGRPRLQ